jgi:hypothetical protein
MGVIALASWQKEDFSLQIIPASCRPEPETVVTSIQRLTSVFIAPLAPPIGTQDIATHHGQQTDSPGLYEPASNETVLNEKTNPATSTVPSNDSPRDAVRQSAVLSGGAPIKTAHHPSQRNTSTASTSAANPPRKGSALHRLTTGLLTPERKIRAVPGYARSWINIAKSNWLNLLLIFIPISWALHFAVGDKNPTAVFLTCFIAVIPLGESRERSGGEEGGADFVFFSCFRSGVAWVYDGTVDALHLTNNWRTFERKSKFPLLFNACAFH